MITRGCRRVQLQLNVLDEEFLKWMKVRADPLSVAQLSSVCGKPYYGQQECTDCTVSYECVKCTVDPTVQGDCTV